MPLLKLDGFWEELIKRINYSSLKQTNIEFKKNKELKFIYWNVRGKGLKWACCLTKTIKPWIELEINPLKGKKQEELYNTLVKNKHSIQKEFEYSIDWDEDDRNLSRMSPNRKMYRIKSSIDCPLFYDLNGKQQERLLSEFVTRMKKFMISFEKMHDGSIKNAIDRKKGLVSNDYPTEPECNNAIKELHNENKKGSADDKVLDRIKEKDPYKGSRWQPDWRKITLKNMKKWSC